MNKDLLGILHLFEIYGLVEIENEQHEDIINSSSKCIILGDENYNRVNKFIVNNLQKEGVIRFGQNSIDYFSPVIMRYRVMQNLEYGVCAENNGDITGYMSISANPSNASKTLVINDIIIDGTLTQEEIIQCLSSMINRMVRIVASIRAISKIRIAVYGDSKSQKLIELIKLIGFKVECVLEDETLMGDMTFYAYFIK